MNVPERGLCGSCRHAREIVSGKGSRFVLCDRSRTDERFPRYPRLPVIACVGFERSQSRSAESPRDADPD